MHRVCRLAYKRAPLQGLVACNFCGKPILPFIGEKGDSMLAPLRASLGARTPSLAHSLQVRRARKKRGSSQSAARVYSCNPRRAAARIAAARCRVASSASAFAFSKEMELQTREWMIGLCKQTISSLIKID